MPFDKQKNQRKAFCFITFDSEQVVNELLKTAKQTISGKEVDVKKATPKPDNAPMMGGGRGGGRNMRGGRGRGGKSIDFILLWSEGFHKLNKGYKSGYQGGWGNSGYGSYGGSYGGGNQGSYGNYDNYAGGYDYNNYGGGYQQGYDSGLCHVSPHLHEDCHWLMHFSSFFLALFQQDTTTTVDRAAVAMEVMVNTIIKLETIKINIKTLDAGGFSCAHPLIF
jgi:hypothetical protein